MKISLSLEKSYSNDLSIMVDVLRASSTITVALDHFQQVVPVIDQENARKISEKLNAVLAGERRGATLNGFNAGNSPWEIQKFNGETLVLTTSNGTRIMEGMNARVLIGCFNNAKAVARAAQEISRDHIELVMAGVEGRFAIEDFLGAGFIMKYLPDEEMDEFARSAVLAIENLEKVDKSIFNSRSGQRLKILGFEKDIEFCLKRNISNNVPIFHQNIITSYRK
ncbi:MAG: 2-phosphosulfolactate phosphatase [Euryarchaeota archaeon]|nr:2-phosphosulfolactate phosphatase [Euryarchaeota archaeon]MBU4607137.1 2-phosphosulfolactate phosphatase [Euryarchaeota archaeon]MBV1729895.1 2-phosphosulfolactate phosphatase [Methanobacterium sp.]MBV1755528.1 2-phosphosulfolactate phosphatase [Methanobacterium sp.]MBV1766727.1 2-phosphosulfolactate phosphatase [Methanobacterium sp.]